MLHRTGRRMAPAASVVGCVVWGGRVSSRDQASPGCRVQIPAPAPTNSWDPQHTAALLLLHKPLVTSEVSGPRGPGHGQARQRLGDGGRVLLCPGLSAFQASLQAHEATWVGGTSGVCRAKLGPDFLPPPRSPLHDSGLCVGRGSPALDAGSRGLQGREQPGGGAGLVLAHSLSLTVCGGQPGSCGWPENTGERPAAPPL